MKSKQSIKKRIISFLVFICMFLPSIALSAETSVLNVAFIGHTTHSNEQVIPYSEQIANGLEKLVGGKVKLAPSGPVDFDDEYFMNVLSPVLSAEADVVFLELNISKRYKTTDSGITAKLEAMVRKLISSEKKPAIYFLYMPEGSLLDRRAPFERVAQHYQIPVIDLYDVVKKAYTRGEGRIVDYLTAGLVPSEKGHTKFAEIILDRLANEKNLTKPITDKNAMTDISSYKIIDVPVSEEPQIKTDGHVFYVSKEGSNKGNGSKENPFNSLEAAKNAIRSIKEKEGVNFTGATVYVREGLYQLKGGFSLDAGDSGTDTAGIIYSAYPGEKVRLTTSSVLKTSDFKHITDAKTLNRLAPNALGEVYEYDLSANGLAPGFHYINQNGTEVSEFTTHRTIYKGRVLVVNGKSETVARYPNGGRAKVADHQPSVNNKIAFNVEHSERWKTATKPWITGTLGQGYYTQNNRVKSIDLENNILTFEGSAPYGVKVGWLWHISDLLEELDMPGEWYVEDETSKLYYYPRGDIKDDEILYSTDIKPVVLMKSTKNVTFEGFTIEGSCGAGVKIIDGIGNKVKDCTLQGLGFCGVHILNSNNVSGFGKNGVTGCHIYNTAVMGVYIQGGDQKGLTAQDDYVENCHIENFAIESHSEAGGILTENTVRVYMRNNTIHNDDSSGIWIGGNEDIMEYNELYNLAKNTDDYGAIYGQHQGALKQGAVYKHNYMHDIVANLEVGVYHWVAGFYTDAQRNNGCRVENNVFTRCITPVFFSNNHNMLAKNNLFIDSERNAVDVRHMHYSLEELEKKNAKLKELLDSGKVEDLRGQGEGKAFDALVYRAYFSTSSKIFNRDTMNNYFLRYPWLETYLEDNPIEAKNMVISENAIFNTNGQDINMPEVMNDYFDVENNYITQDTVPFPENGSEYARIDNAMQVAKNEISAYEPWDVRLAGITSPEREIGAFDILYPNDNSSEIDTADLRLCWDYASGADEYHVEIATDEAFKNIVFEGDSRDNYIKATGLQIGGKKYFWRVTAKSFSEHFLGTPQNANGIHSFETIRFKQVGIKKLQEELAAAKRIYEGMQEGREQGMYPAGSKQEMFAAIERAEKFYQLNIDNPIDFTEETQILASETRRILAKINVGERLLSDKELNPVQLQFCKWGSSNVLEATKQTNITYKDNELKFDGNGSIYSKEKIEAHEIIRLRAKFDFGGETAGHYSMISLRCSGLTGYMYNTSCYVFLVTNDNIELQGFKAIGGGAGKFYKTVPNNFIKAGQYHDIEFCALPANNGNAVRIILTVDGNVVYDYLDETNPIISEGYLGINSAQSSTSISIMPPTSDPSYPTILEMLADSQSALNKKAE